MLLQYSVNFYLACAIFRSSWWSLW